MCAHDKYKKKSASIQPVGHQSGHRVHKPRQLSSRRATDRRPQGQLALPSLKTTWILYRNKNYLYLNGQYYLIIRACLPEPLPGSSARLPPAPVLPNVEEKGGPLDIFRGVEIRKGPIVNKLNSGGGTCGSAVGLESRFRQRGG